MPSRKMRTAIYFSYGLDVEIRPKLTPLSWLSTWVAQGGVLYLCTWTGYTNNICGEAPAAAVPQHSTAQAWPIGQIPSIALAQFATEGVDNKHLLRELVPVFLICPELEVGFK